MFLRPSDASEILAPPPPTLDGGCVTSHQWKEKQNQLPKWRGNTENRQDTSRNNDNGSIDFKFDFDASKGTHSSSSSYTSRSNNSSRRSSGRMSDDSKKGEGDRFSAGFQSRYKDVFAFKEVSIKGSGSGSGSSSSDPPPDTTSSSLSNADAKEFKGQESIFRETEASAWEADARREDSEARRRRRDRDEGRRKKQQVQGKFHKFGTTFLSSFTYFLHMQF